MDCLKAIQGYIDKIITETSGIKILLLDSETVSSTFKNHRSIFDLLTIWVLLFSDFNLIISINSIKIIIT